MPPLFFSIQQNAQDYLDERNEARYFIPSSCQEDSEDEHTPEAVHEALGMIHSLLTHIHTSMIFCKFV